MYQLTEDPDLILCLATGATIPRGHYLWPTEWLLTNTPAPIPPPYLPNTPAHHRAIRDAAWAWMAAVVQERGYDSIESCCSYVTSAVPRYKAEALAMVAWRDAVNQTLEQLVLNPPAGVDSWEEVRALLPQPEAFPWPEKVDLPLDGSDGPIQLPPA
ncbi:hypothetical protein [Stenotrophomonas sp. VV52]|uniref:hypothetical protein n=1 Tax=Stenotrophomonas sp. VV52 TaxID=2066958 RepID=UPI000C9E17CA|nr:hypothetical protein [Stenotrophomonas sp. VV52]